MTLSSSKTIMKACMITSMKPVLIILSLLLFQLEAHAEDGQYVETNGVTIYYETFGEGEPLLLLHGFNQNHDIWGPWVEALSKNHKLIMPDLRGHGNSSNPDKIFTHKLSAVDIYGLMDHLKIQHFKAIGFSSGAMTLTHMATKDTSRIMAMILIGATSFYPEQTAIKQSSLFFETMSAKRTDRMLARHPGGEPQIRMLLAQYRSMAKNFDDMNFTAPYLATIKNPTLTIHGDHDALFPVEIAADFYKAIPNGYLWVVPNGGHIPVGSSSIWSDMFLQVADDFLSGKWQQPK